MYLLKSSMITMKTTLQRVPWVVKLKTKRHLDYQRKLHTSPKVRPSEVFLFYFQSYIRIYIGKVLRSCKYSLLRFCVSYDPNKWFLRFVCVRSATGQAVCTIIIKFGVYIAHSQRRRSLCIPIFKRVPFCACGLMT